MSTIPCCTKIRENRKGRKFIYSHYSDKYFNKHENLYFFFSTLKDERKTSSYDIWLDYVPAYYTH